MPSQLTKKSLKIKVSPSIGSVSAIFYSPAKAKQVLVFAHGAGLSMKSKFMEQVSLTLAGLGIASLRFNFPYMEKGKRMPDTKPVCTATVKAAVDKASILSPKHPIFAGGKSFGGRMTSTTASEGMIPSVKGIIFFGFPLHAPGKPSNDRAEHLYKVEIPMLFLQGSRDALATLDMLKPVIKKIGSKASLFVIEGGDHSFHCPKEYGIKDSEAIKMLCDEVKRWMFSQKK